MVDRGCHDLVVVTCALCMWKAYEHARKVSKVLSVLRWTRQSQRPVKPSEKPGRSDRRHHLGVKQLCFRGELASSDYIAGEIAGQTAGQFDTIDWGPGVSTSTQQRLRMPFDMHH